MADANKDKKKKKKTGGWKHRLKRLRDKSVDRLKSISPMNKDSFLGQMFQNFSLKKHLPKSVSQDAAVLLQQQLEQYQAEIEMRKQKGHEEGILREGDDKLPYEQQSINFIQGMKEPSSISSSKSSSSSSEKSAGEQSGQLANVLLGIVMDAQRSDSIRKEDEEKLELPAGKLAMMSRKDLDGFDKIVNENTKQGLFLSQPTSEEQKNWNERRARPHHMNLPAHPVTIINENIEKKIFCHSCNPRHVNGYPFRKNSEKSLRG